MKRQFDRGLGCGGDWLKGQRDLLNALTWLIDLSVQAEAVEKDACCHQALFVGCGVENLARAFPQGTVRIAHKGQGVIPGNAAPRQRMHIIQYRFNLRLNQHMGQRAIIVGNSIAILYLLLAIETGKPIGRLPLKRRHELDNRGIAHHGFTRGQAQTLGLDHHRFIQKTVHPCTGF